MPLVANTDAARAHLDTADNIALPIFPSGADDASHTMFIASPIEQDLIKVACGNTTWNEIGSPDILDVYVALAHQLPLTRIIPLEHQPDNADFLWSKARVLMAGAGYSNHAVLSAILVSLYPLCPFDASATIEVWREDLRKAHKACGWPVTMGHVCWRDLTSALDMVPTETMTPPCHWMTIMALLHVLKHLRRTPTGSLAYVFSGIGATVKMEDGSDTIGNWLRQKQVIVKSLGCRPAKGKLSHPMTHAMDVALNRLTVSSILTMRPITKLPPHIIAGPWSTTIPDPSHMKGFYQTGLRVDGVWIAENGRVRPYTGDQSDVVDYAWNFTDPGTFGTAREEITRIMPQTYVEGWPSDTFLDAFPNIDMSGFSDLDAAKVLLDLPWFASFLRNERDFAREYPMVVFMPTVPTFDQSTSQGKTLAAHTFGRVMVPAVPCVGAMDTGSAPDSRALADTLMQHGTVVLEEWTPPKSKGHVLAHAHLQTLITGSSIALGRVLENSGTVKLHHSMIASAKALDIPPDMVNRTLFWFMREFTEAETARSEVVQRLVSGSTAMEMKLQVIGKVESAGLVDGYASSPRTKVNGLRFDDHGSLARLLYKLRTGRDESGELAAALVLMRSRHVAHTDTADSSGVISSLEDGGMTRIRLSSLMSGLDDSQMRDLNSTLASYRDRGNRATGPWNTVGELVNAVKTLRGRHDLQSMLSSIATVRGRPTDRVIIQAVTTDMRGVMPGLDAVFHIQDANFFFTRGPDRNRQFTYRLDENPPA